MLHGGPQQGLRLQGSRAAISRVGTVVRAQAVAAKMETVPVDRTLNPAVAGVKPSKTMALTDLATSMKEKGIDVSSQQIRSSWCLGCGIMSKQA
jgi:hypothetical protein